jgi:hypothetical protein
MRFLSTLALTLVLSSCAVVAVADLALTTAATVAKAGVKTVGAAVDLAVPDKKPPPDQARSR